MENLLPTEIVLDIFSRLPVESIVHCRQTCKTWRNILHHPDFADMHLRRSQLLDKVGLLYSNMQSENDNMTQLYYGEYDENDKESYKTLKKVNRFPFNKDYDIVGSCNGLVCFYGYNKYEELADSTYICNPITREYLNLPSYNFDIIRENCTIRGIICGFGHVLSTNEYKVVRILFSRGRNQPPSSKWVGFVQVYTLGSSTGWRNKGGITGSFSYSCIFVNEALHWLEDEEMKILAFDLKDEEFRLVPSPPCFAPGRNNIFKLKVLQGFLCFVHEKRGRCVDIWMLKKNCTKFVMEDLEQDCQSWTWHREFRMALKGLVNAYDPFAITKSGGVLLWFKHSILSHYGTQNKAFKRLDMDKQLLEAIPHTHSFVSLKGLGEEDAMIIRSAKWFQEEEMLQLTYSVKNSFSLLC